VAQDLVNHRHPQQHRNRRIAGSVQHTEEAATGHKCTLPRSTRHESQRGSEDTRGALRPFVPPRRCLVWPSVVSNASSAPRRAVGLPDHLWPAPPIDEQVVEGHSSQELVVDRIDQREPFAELALAAAREADPRDQAHSTSRSNGRLEALNSKMRLLSHRAYGFHSADALIAMIYLCCAAIQIELPHR
jgi:hypothetical protein